MSAATFIAAVWAVILSLGNYNPAEVQGKDPSSMSEYETAKQMVLDAEAAKDGGQIDLIDAG